MRLERIWKSFGPLEVLTDVSMSVPRGEVVCIIGPSGSGKSTLLRCINHLEAIDDGTIYFEGKPVYRYKVNGKLVVDPERRVEAIRARIGMVFQSFNLFPHLTALGNVIEAPVRAARTGGAKARKRGLELLTKVGLTEKGWFIPASAQWRAAAAGRDRARTGDEPQAHAVRRGDIGIDPELVGEVLAVMRQLANEGMTMIVVTHEMDFARDVADRVIFMDCGAIVSISSAGVVFPNPRSPRTRQFLQSVLNRSGAEAAAQEST